MLLFENYAEFNNNKIVSKDEKSFSDACPDSVYKLFQYPSSSEIKKESLNDNLPELSLPKQQFYMWLKKVLDPAWLPEKNVKTIFMRDKFSTNDVIYLSWVKNSYAIKVSQTKSIFTIILSPQQNGTGKVPKQKFRIAQKLCLELFIKKGKRFNDQGNVIPVMNLAKKIALYSFHKQLVKTSYDKILYGRYKTVKEERINAFSNERWQFKVPMWQAEPIWCYWFRMVSWWNSGTSIGFYFPKAEINLNSQYFSKDADKAWF